MEMRASAICVGRRPSLFVRAYHMDRGEFRGRPSAGTVPTPLILVQSEPPSYIIREQTQKEFLACRQNLVFTGGLFLVGGPSRGTVICITFLGRQGCE